MTVPVQHVLPLAFPHIRIAGIYGYASHPDTGEALRVQVEAVWFDVGPWATVSPFAKELYARVHSIGKTQSFVVPAADLKLVSATYRYEETQS